MSAGVVDGFGVGWDFVGVLAVAVAVWSVSGDALGSAISSSSSVSVAGRTGFGARGSLDRRS